jgi:hypothetical protein
MIKLSNLRLPNTTASSLAFLTLLSFDTAFAQNIVVPSGTAARAQLIKSSSVHNGQELSAKLMDSIYVGDKLVLPAGTLLQGNIVDLTADRKRRIRARLNGDFTPFHQSHVSFHSMTLPSGQTVQVETTQEMGSVVVQLMSPQNSGRAGSYLRQAWTVAKDDARRATEVVTAPDKGERLQRFAYSQLPYHPEKLYKGVAYAFEFAKPVEFPVQPDPSTAPKQPLPAGVQTNLRAYLKTPISSRETKFGTAIEAVVAEPYFDASRELTIPQGATLLGTVTQAKPARWFGRSGKLRFAFKQVRFPEGEAQTIQGTPAAVGAEKTQELTMDAEGGVKAAPKDRFIRPLLLAYLANYASEGDGGNSLGGDAVASNSFGLVGRIAGIAGGSPNLALGIGYYAVATSSYDGFIAKGPDVVFPRNTRLEIQLRPAKDRQEQGVESRKSLSQSSLQK